MGLLTWAADRRVERARTKAQQDARTAIERRDEQIAELKDQIAGLQEALEAERVTVRIQKLEVELLAGIHARDVQRWQVEHTGDRS